jgi:hypothetical protein
MGPKQQVIFGSRRVCDRRQYDGDLALVRHHRQRRRFKLCFRRGEQRIGLRLRQRIGGVRIGRMEQRLQRYRSFLRPLLS